MTCGVLNWLGLDIMNGWYWAEMHILAPAACVGGFLWTFWSAAPYAIEHPEGLYEDNGIALIIMFALAFAFVVVVYLWLWPNSYQTLGKHGRYTRLAPTDAEAYMMRWLRERGIEHDQHAELRTRFLVFRYQGERTEIVFKPSILWFWYNSVLVGPRKVPGTEDLMRVIEVMIESEGRGIDVSSARTE